MIRDIFTEPGYHLIMPEESNVIPCSSVQGLSSALFGQYSTLTQEDDGIHRPLSDRVSILKDILQNSFIIKIIGVGRVHCSS